MHTAVYVAPVGNRHASHWMYWSADGRMMNANGEMIGHHWRSFQSVQKSQSPAKSSLVMSAAAPTTNAAVIQKTIFFFQAEDGIRDVAVTGVQTCALPI